MPKGFLRSVAESGVHNLLGPAFLDIDFENERRMKGVVGDVP
jgi:stage V sporulation protein SpoVS